jgi:CheY-like chemotaxis protein
MPVMNGDDATEALRSRGITVPIVGLTGDAHSDDLTTFLQRGASEVPVACPTLRRAQVLTKPVPRALLQRVIDVYILKRG